MRKVTSILLCVAFLLCSTGVLADNFPRGVIAEERIVNLPNDQAKWYISVVGDENDAGYCKLINWFETNEKLAKLKDQVHFCPVTSGSAIFKARYAGNVTGLPMIRMQQPDGTVVYQVSGKKIPMSAEGLNGAIAESVRPVLPWRRNHVHPQPLPEPDAVPDGDPEPQPIDDGDVPFIDEPSSRGVPTGICVVVIVLSVLAGATTGVVVQWKKTYAE